MVHAGCVFVAGIHPPRTWMSRSFESMQWNARVHRLDCALYSHVKEFLGNHVNCRGKLLSDGGWEEGLPSSAASGWTVSPTHYQLSLSGPRFRFKAKSAKLRCQGISYFLMNFHTDTNTEELFFWGTKMICMNWLACQLLAVHFLSGNHNGMSSCEIFLQTDC